MAETTKKRSPILLISLILIIVGLIIAVIGGILWGTIGVEKYITYKTIDVSQPLTTSDGTEIKNIDIDIGVATVNIHRGGDKIVVHGEYLPDSDYTVGVQGSTFTVKSRYGFNIFGLKELISVSINTPTLDITLPDKVYETVSFNVGTGDIEADGITAEKLDLDIGTGKLKATNFKISSDIKIDLGTGNVDMKNIEANRIDVDCGTGDMDYTGTITGRLDVDCGVGSAQFNIRGHYFDYDIDIDKGVGNVDINKGDINAVSSRSKDERPIPIKVDVGVGNVSLNFIGDK